MKRSFTLLWLLLTSPLLAGTPADPKPTTPATPMPKFTDTEWKKLLTPEQYAVTREAATERPFGQIYKEFEAQGEGTYYCVCCGAELFTSTEKFHSGCGWPSFYDSSKAKNVEEHTDISHGMKRVETVCKRCGAHLGHVFEGEGYKTPTDRRFCINGVALTFVAKGGKAPELRGVEEADVQKKKAEVNAAAEASPEVPKKP
jgi:peptide-methionine (R)-S-oxide reductase